MNAAARPTGVFVSYRREENSRAVEGLSSVLASRLGRDRVFRDVDSISPGEDFGRRLLSSLRSSDLVVVVIGPQWVSLKGPDGFQKLKDPKDYVHMEVSIALRLKEVLPVLIDGASIPKEEELPEPLRRLVRRQVVVVRPETELEDLEAVAGHATDIVRKVEAEREAREKVQARISVQDYFEIILPSLLRMKTEREAELMAEANCSICFKIHGAYSETWTVVLKNRRPRLVRGAGEPSDCTVNIEYESMEDVLNGRFDARAAVASGAVVIMGDPHVLKNFGQIFF